VEDLIKIVFENEHFVILDKPSGVLTTPSRFAGEDSRQCLGTLLQSQLGLQIFPVHRLDFEVSGLVIFAKTPKAHRVANGWFENKEIQKTYFAQTCFQDLSSSYVLPQIISAITGYEVEWRCTILRGKRRTYESSAGKMSITKAKVVEVKLVEKKILWEIMPITGRPHQLRFELARHGFPIDGDELYGSKVALPNSTIHLRAFRLLFVGSEKNPLPQFGFPQEIEINRGH